MRSERREGETEGEREKAMIHKGKGEKEKAMSHKGKGEKENAMSHKGRGRGPHAMANRGLLKRCSAARAWRSMDVAT